MSWEKKRKKKINQCSLPNGWKFVSRTSDIVLGRKNNFRKIGKSYIGNKSPMINMFNKNNGFNKGTGQNLSDIRTWTIWKPNVPFSIKSYYVRYKKGGLRVFFEKKIMRSKTFLTKKRRAKAQRLFFRKNKAQRLFFSEKIRRKDFFDYKKGGEEFFQANLSQNPV